MQGSSASTTTLTLGPVSIVPAGAVTGAVVAATADTTNGCLNLTWTAPNADAWHVAARIDAMEIQ